MYRGCYPTRGTPPRWTSPAAVLEGRREHRGLPAPVQALGAAEQRRCSPPPQCPRTICDRCLRHIYNDAAGINHALGAHVLPNRCL